VRDVSKEQEIRKLLSKIDRDRLAKEAILQVAFHSFVTTTTKGVITFVNEAAVRTLAYGSAEELVGQNIKTIVGGCHAQHHDGYMAKFMETREKHIIGSQREVPVRRKDGSEFPGQLGIQFIENNGGAEPFFVAFIRDVSLEKRQIALEAEKKAAEELLLNMLPKEIALRLKDNPRYLADHHATATILFADIVGKSCYRGVRCHSDLRAFNVSSFFRF